MTVGEQRRKVERREGGEPRHSVCPYRARRCVSLRDCLDRFGLYGRDVGYGNFANFEKYTAEVNCIYAGFHYSISGVGGHSGRIGLWRLVDRWGMAALGLLDERDPARPIWYRDDSFFGNQIAA